MYKSEDVCDSYHDPRYSYLSFQYQGREVRLTFFHVRLSVDVMSPLAVLSLSCPTTTGNKEKFSRWFIKWGTGGCYPVTGNRKYEIVQDESWN